jgi:hypothetical protein
MARRTALLLAIAALLPALSSCATIPEDAGGKENLPNAGFGPFRPLTTEELGNSRSGPNALDDDSNYARDVAVIDLDGDPKTFDVNGYVAAAVEENGEDPEPDAPTRVILRYGAIDGRSFDRAREPVLLADQAWEGGVLAGPAALRVGSEIHLYYAAEGGIGLARGDGVIFVKETGPVLAPEFTNWEKGRVPKSPGVVELSDGSLRMFYEIAISDEESVIGEARSDDGVTWTRVGSDPALTPQTGFEGDAGDAPYDARSVGSPFPILATSADDRPILRVYYAARDGTGRLTIGLAARYGDEPLQRAVGPVFGSEKPVDAREPCVIEFEGFSLLFATQKANNTAKHGAIAVGVAPATAKLPPPMPR